MWPMFVDYSDEECKRVLRSLELEAYASIINAFRAQGNLTKDRKKMLQDLSCALSIPIERHRAEIRRAVNDEHLNTIAERLCGPNTATEWAIEGRRVVPLMQRLAPQTVFTEIANSVASAQATKNASLPLPGKTGLREMSNGTETMASRKRRDYTPDSTVSPQKISAMDSQYFHSLLPPENLGEQPMETSQVPESSLNSENFTTESGLQVPCFPDLSVSKALASMMGNSSSITSKQSSKHQLLKSSTITTYSSFDQMSSNLMSSRNASQATTPVINLEEPTWISPELSKPSSELKTAQRQLSSVSSGKSTTIVIPTQSASPTTVSSKERLPTSPMAPSQSSKFLQQLRSKAPSHSRQGLPAGLGIKLNPQTQVSQRATVPLSKSTSMKMKHESPSIFTKKAPSTGMSSLSDNQASHFPGNLPSSETLTVTKSSLTVTKSNMKIETNTSSANQPLASKHSPLSKSVPKTTASVVTTTSHNPGYISRSLFSTANKNNAKSLPPVIFNVSSTSSATHQTTTKTTSPITSEAGKSAQQLLPKSTTVGISSSHLKINTSNAQTIQYRNDGGLVRSARIVNISQPVGSRLPCAISPSAISALGLSNALSPTALRVTLPAGTLTPSSALRVSAAAKPNVIVVHKAQVWPRAQQGAVIMSSAAPATAPLAKVTTTSDVVQETIITTKQQDKKTPATSKPAPRAIAPARPQSPAVSVTSVRISESSLMQSPSSQPDSTTDGQNSKSQDNPAEGQVKRNLLIDISEESGSTEKNSAKVNTKEKGNEGKTNKNLPKFSNHQDLEITLAQKGNVTSTKASPQHLPESNSAKKDVCKPVSAGEPGLSITQIDKNVKEVTKQITPPTTEVQQKESVTVTPVTTTEKESTITSNESASIAQKEKVIEEIDL